MQKWKVNQARISPKNDRYISTKFPTIFFKAQLNIDNCVKTGIMGTTGFPLDWKKYYRLLDSHLLDTGRTFPHSVDVTQVRLCSFDNHFGKPTQGFIDVLVHA